MSDTGAVPDEVVIVHHAAGQPGTWIPVSEVLVGASGAPLWNEHPAHQRAVDVVALPLTATGEIDTYPYDPWAAGPGMAIGVAGPLSIVGFPFGQTGGGSLGIWVRGWIATEVDIDFNNLPCFLIDSRTRPGQSGSPVIAYQNGGMVPMANGGSAVFSGPIEQFVGVYSGRLNEQSDLGFVWKASALCEIIDKGVSGSVALLAT